MSCRIVLQCMYLTPCPHPNKDIYKVESSWAPLSTMDLDNDYYSFRCKDINGQVVGMAQNHTQSLSGF